MAKKEAKEAPELSEIAQSLQRIEELLRSIDESAEVLKQAAQFYLSSAAAKLRM